MARNERPSGIRGGISTKAYVGIVQTRKVARSLVAASLIGEDDDDWSKARSQPHHGLPSPIKIGRRGPPTTRDTSLWVRVVLVIRASGGYVSSFCIRKVCFSSLCSGDYFLAL